MKSKTILLLSLLTVLALVVFACQPTPKNVPPSPPAPGESVGRALGGLAVETGEDPCTGFACPPLEDVQGEMPFTLLTNPPFLQYLNAEQLNSLEVSVVRDEFVWKTAYLTDKEGNWVAFDFALETDAQEVPSEDGSGAWITGGREDIKALVNLELSLAADVNLGEQENYVIAYACSCSNVVNLECVDWNCHDNKWMLRDIPVEGVGCSSDVECADYAASLGDTGSYSCRQDPVTGEGFCTSGEPLAPVLCGDGVVGGTEQCDDGNGMDGDGCETDCTLTSQVSSS